MARYIDSTFADATADWTTRRPGARPRGGTGASRHVDVLVVGARCAGAATAMLLARAGHQVVMVDRSQPSTDTNSTHSLVRGGVVQLARWGLLDEVVATGAPEIRSVSFHHEGEVERRAVRDRAGVDFLLAPRRSVLDDLLARAAVAAGAELVTGTSVTGVLREGDRVVGVTTRDADGTSHDVTARLVVGADGVYSGTARHVGAEVVERHDPSGAAFYTYVGGVPWDGFEFHLGERSFAGVFPTHDHLACVWLIRPVADLAPVIAAGSDRLDAWLGALDHSAPDLARRVRRGFVTAPLRGSVGLPNHVRRAAGPGWALVGDAGFHRDPITGHGMTDAFRDAELLADAADAMLRRAVPEDVAMAGYERQRDEALAPTFALTRALGAFPPAARFLDLQRRLSRALDTEATALAARPAPLGVDAYVA
jgi:2-polyprenyl-6-methoxyphenol hydroxylase-like FAD-dependent oxidoreductase